MIDGSIRLSVARDGPRVAERLVQLSGVQVEMTGANSIELTCSDVTRTLVAVVNALRELNIELLDLKPREAHLEQVFLHLTEKTLRN